ncbi:hypothetical protein G5I_14223 [Acromyrmex echinatior]|uniref:Uncharacterized protein n=1 Tax=Acromyrmex echinatior TaxID=103372 RepID=F4X785_ACREC|nr:hypothetical protein G5I_14223 [Acromyrmex echinatior]
MTCWASAVCKHSSRTGSTSIAKRLRERHAEVSTRSGLAWPGPPPVPAAGLRARRHRSSRGVRCGITTRKPFMDMLLGEREGYLSGEGTSDGHQRRRDHGDWPATAVSELCTQDLNVRHGSPRWNMILRIDQWIRGVLRDSDNL